ncbi:MAG: hypothetical protein QF903_13460 [Planctomycetota bacterium]|jgi:hypothetical protein|nr:hypothetical protein [Planctomycetota bacterium]MDP6762567.1 hypothetical protein [Planctomycetota bacterium]MDP6990471.1 hypothetical protein [Planctomycetota bacterium]
MRRDSRGVPTTLLIRAGIVLLLGVHARAQQWGPWHVVGPFDHPAGYENLDLRHAVETELPRMRPGQAGPDLERRFRGKDRLDIGWRTAAGGGEAFDVGRVDLRTQLAAAGGEADWADFSAAYLHREIRSSTDRELRVHMGSDDGLVVWLNGTWLYEHAIGRGVGLYDEALVLPLEEGVNHLLVKVVNGGGGWGFRMGPWRKVPHAAIQAAVERGVDHFLEGQLLDGSWGGHRGTTPGNTAFRLYVLLKCGLRPDHPAIQRGRAFVLAHDNPAVYACAAEILALAEIGLEEDRAHIRELVSVMEESVMDDGLFRYSVAGYNSHAARGDLSNALFAALALRAAAHAQVTIKPSLWATVARGALACQAPTDGHPRTGRAVEPRGFGYTPGRAPTSSMTVAGVSMLAIVDREAGTRVLPRLRGPIKVGIRAGLAWLREHFSWNTNSGHPSGHHKYFNVYGIERIGGLLGRPHVASRDWYFEGTEWLLARQSAAGTWSETAGHVETELALLFLARATASLTGKSTTGAAPSWSTPEDPRAEVQLRGSGDTPATIWIEALSEAEVADLEWPGQRSLGPHVERVDYYALRDLPDAPEVRIGRVEADASVPAGTDRFPIRHRFEANGRWFVHARVTCVRKPEAPGVAGERVELVSDEMELSVENVVAPEQLAYAADAARNLLRGQELVTTASSHISGEERWKIKDGHYGTRWHCATTDKQPWVKIDLPRSVRARAVALTHGWPAQKYADAARPFRGQLVINGREEIGWEMDPDPMVKTNIDLGRTRRVRSLELRITEVLNGTLGRNAVGFSEVEVFR